MCLQNVPIENPVLIVEVLINRQDKNEDEDQDLQLLKFTFNKEDLHEVSKQAIRQSK